MFADDSGLSDSELSGEEGKDVYPLREFILRWSTMEELTRTVEYGRRNNWHLFAIPTYYFLTLLHHWQEVCLYLICQTSEPIEYVAKEIIAQTGRLSDVVMPIHCEQTARAWVESQPNLAQIPCRKQPTCHGNARKRSNHSKSNAVLQQFLDFVDKNSASNRRKEGSHGKTFYFNPKFTQIRTPNKDDPQYSTNANKVFYMSSTALLLWKGLVQFQLEQHSTGWRNIDHMLVSAHPCLIIVTHVKNMRRRYLVVGKSSTDFTRVEMQHQVGSCYIHLTCTFQPTQCHYF